MWYCVSFALAPVGDSTEEAAGSGVADRRAEIAGAANSTVPKPSEEQAEGAVRSKACTEGMYMCIYM